MPRIQVAFYQEANGEAPVVSWLQELMETNEKAWAHCRARIELLTQLGHELRRPAADYLRDGIYELRAKQGHCPIPNPVFLPRQASGDPGAQPDQRRHNTGSGHRTRDWKKKTV